MLLLILFALIAGAGTAITPCVLPVLPALLSASALGGRRRPLGIVVGLAATFTIAIVALAQLVKGVGLASGVAMAFNLDVRFEESLAKANLPAVLVDPTRALENSNAVQGRLASLRPASRFAERQKEASQNPVPETAGVSISGVKTPSLPDLGPAPVFTYSQRWINPPQG